MLQNIIIRVYTISVKEGIQAESRIVLGRSRKAETDLGTIYRLKVKVDGYDWEIFSSRDPGKRSVWEIEAHVNALALAQDLVDSPILRLYLEETNISVEKLIQKRCEKMRDALRRKVNPKNGNGPFGKYIEQLVLGPAYNEAVEKNSKRKSNTR